MTGRKYAEKGKLSPVLPDPIDAAIFAAVGGRWQKTAMVIARAEIALRKSGHEVSFEVIGERIEVLAQEGRLDSQGDLTLWRHSEVRMADPKTL